MQSWLKILNRFRSDERGNIALLFGLSLVPVVGAAGVAVDYGKASNMKTVLQTEVDATALEVARAAVVIHTMAPTSSQTPSQRQALIDQQIVNILAARTAIAQSRSSINNTNFAYAGEWSDSLKTEYKVTASVDVHKHVRVLNSSATTSVASSATAKLHYEGVVTTTNPTMNNPGYEAGDYNRIYAYCYNKDEPVVANRRSKMTVISSNGTDGSGGTPEMTSNPVFSNIVMPSCDAASGETLSWRLYNVRGQRTTKSKWPIDSAQYNPPSNYSSATDASGVTIYNHYSDTLINAATGVESYQFRGDALGYPNPISMMETFVCDTQAACTPGGAGSIIPSNASPPYNMPKNRAANQASTKCEPGKFMYIGWEDRPHLTINNNGDYTNANSYQWTDADYDDIRLVVSCPSTTITSYTSKISLIK
jgi:Flp pilus assembly protein TadG